MSSEPASSPPTLPNTRPNTPPHQRRRGLRVAAVVVVVAAAAVVVFGVVSRTSNAARLQERATEQSVPTVVLIRPGRSAPGGNLDLPGRLEAYSRAPIYARISGYLKSWKVDIGAPVKAGQLLAEIETPDLDQQLLQAKADLASTRANASLAGSTAKRWQSLVAADAVSRQEADEKAGDLVTKQAIVSASQANVNRYLAMKAFTRIVAPFDGTVTSRTTDVGALINAGGGAGQELFVVSDTRRLRVYVGIPQNFVSVIRRGTGARISVPEHPGRFYQATVESTSQAVNAASGSMLVQLVVDNAQAELLPGGYASVSFELPRDVATLNIPPGALIFGKAGPRVATVGADDKVVLKAVTIARDLGKVIELASGLGPDDRIIESPPDSIADGDPVRIAKAPAGNDAGIAGAPRAKS
jgi:RND family efflux transporter MFP subunit